ncbi:hypothetical protein COLO4_16100 [Corchorus olitorius]|uniref:Uncharacterized protein n=1 Tax=Corchorus olitorius TaxID=93759 RepID=A0A1R3JJI0_9ROSI|nr:hypothetical protein COLO4_16100 [Corchorus olitorius]
METILERLDALGIDANNSRNNREPRVEAALDELVNRQGQRVEDRVAVDNQIAAKNRAITVVVDDSEEEELEPNRAKNMALKAEVMQQERSRQNYDNYRAAGSDNKDKKKLTDRRFNNNNRQNQNYREEKAMGKRVVAEGGDNKKGDNPYAKIRGVTCYRCNNKGIGLMSVHRGRQ